MKDQVESLCHCQPKREGFVGFCAKVIKAGFVILLIEMLSVKD